MRVSWGRWTSRWQNLTSDSLTSQFFDFVEESREVQREMTRQVRENHGARFDDKGEFRSAFSSSLMSVTA